MARVLYGKQALIGLEQLITGFSHQDKKLAFAVADAIAEMVGELERYPLGGAPLPGGLRQLHIPQGDAALLALYRYLALEDRVEILLLQPCHP
jgi:hypothetical protein